MLWNRVTNNSDYRLELYLENNIYLQTKLVLFQFRHYIVICYTKDRVFTIQHVLHEVKCNQKWLMCSLYDNAACMQITAATIIEAQYLRWPKIYGLPISIQVNSISD